MRDIQHQRFERNVFVVNDIIGVLLAVRGAADPVLREFDTPESRAYRAGFNNAILAIATGLHVVDEVKARMR